MNNKIHTNASSNTSQTKKGNMFIQLSEESKRELEDAGIKVNKDGTIRLNSSLQLQPDSSD